MTRLMDYYSICCLLGHDINSHVALGPGEDALRAPGSFGPQHQHQTF